MFQHRLHSVLLRFLSRNITLIVVCLAICGIVAAAGFHVKARMASPLRAQQPGNKVIVSTNDYVPGERMWPQLRGAYSLIGDRFVKPGKERTTMIGTLTAGQGAPMPVRIVLEHPGKIRLEESDGVTAFDGTTLKTTKKTFDKKDEDKIESLLFDSAEHFYVGHALGNGTRFLGDRFRPQEGMTTSYTGPFYDIYEISDKITHKPKKRSQVKRYFLNSDSQLLEMIRYEDDTKTNVEIRLGKYQKVNDQMLATEMTRLENGSLVFRLSISSAVIGQKAADGIFN